MQTKEGVRSVMETRPLLSVCQREPRKRVKGPKNSESKPLCREETGRVSSSRSEAFCRFIFATIQSILSQLRQNFVCSVASSFSALPI